MVYKIADFPISVEGTKHVLFPALAKYYLSEEKPIVTFNITQDDIECEKKAEPSVDSEEMHEYTAVLRKFGEWLPLHNAFVLHSACFDVDGVGVVFAAHSGTGKTTHMKRWKQYLTDRLQPVNGDKPIIRFFDDEPNIPYAYGSPWKGKERYGKNIKSPIKHICFIERSEKTEIEKINKEDVIDLIFNQVYMPRNNPMAVVNTMELIDRFVSSCNLWKIKCNMDADAGKIAYKEIFESE